MNNGIENLAPRGDMDPTTPHGQAQLRFDELVEVAAVNGTHVRFSADGEPEIPSPTSRETVIFDSSRLPISEGVGHKKKKGEPRQNHPRTRDMKGFTGFYRGTYYNNGVARPRK